MYEGSVCITDTMCDRYRQVSWLYHRRTVITVSVFISVLVLLGVNQENDVMINSRQTDSNIATSQLIYLNSTTTRDNSRKKVIFFTYMRSGSTFLGELSRQNPKHMFWFEAIDGMYSHMYGTAFGWYPLDITNLVNGTPRILPQFEKDVLDKSILGLLHCKLDKVPLEVLSHDNMFKPRHRHIPHYVDCYKRTLNKNTKNNKKFSHFNLCLRPLRHICPRKFTGLEVDRLKLCHQELHRPVLHNKTIPITLAQNPENWEKLVKKKQGDKMMTKMTSFFDEMDPEFRASIFDNYRDCVEPYHQSQQHCLSYLYNVCEKAEASVIKVIRITMETVKRILQIDPEIKVIHLLRDPRAIVQSRYGSLISGVAKFLSMPDHSHMTKQLNEAKLLCEKITSDLRVRKQLESRYKKTFLEIKYEDLATKPVDTYKVIYKFLGLELNEEIEIWLDDNTHSHKKSKMYNTARKNSTETAYNWEKSMNYRLVKDINKVCGDVLKYLGYS